MNMPNILTRIKLKHTKGAEIAYVYDFKTLKQLNLVPSEFDPSETFLNVGDNIIYEGEKFRIVNIYTKFFNETDDLNNGKGTSDFGTNKKLPFNFQITFELDNERW